MGYNTLIQTAVAHWPLQDDAANTTVEDAGGSYDGTLQGGSNTADLSTTGPTTWLPKALAFDGVDDFLDFGGTVGNFTSTATLVAWVQINTASATNSRLWHRRTAGTGFAA